MQKGFILKAPLTRGNFTTNSNGLNELLMINFDFLGGLFIPDMSGVQASNTTSGIVAAPFVFYITWAAIYLWQVLWIVYLLTTMCRKRKGEYLYVEPDVWHPAFLVMFMLNNAVNIAWVFLHNRRIAILYEWAPIMIMSVTLYIPLALSVMHLTANSSKMMQLGLRADIWLIRLFVHNGLGIYAAWMTMESLLHVGIAVTKSGSIESDIISTAIYSIILVELLFWFFIDMSFLDKWTRYLLTPYLVYAFVLAGIVYVDHDMIKRNSIFSVVLTGIAGVFLIVKMAVMIWRHNNRPLLQSDDQKLENNHIA